MEILNTKAVIILLTVSFSVNGGKIEKENLNCIEIKRKDYIDYVELLKKNNNNFHKVQK